MDMASSTGFGAIFNYQWCCHAWLQVWHDQGFCKNLTLLKLFLIVAIELWGSQLANKKVLFWTDNLNVVQCINNLTFFSLPVLSLLRHLDLWCLRYYICFRARHLPEVENIVADALFHFIFQAFCNLLPEVEEICTPFPKALWRLVEAS